MSMPISEMIPDRVPPDVVNGAHREQPEPSVPEVRTPRTPPPRWPSEGQAPTTSEKYRKIRLFWGLIDLTFVARS